MARSRSGRNQEDLHGLIRQQTKEIKHLKKELSRALKIADKGKSLAENFIGGILDDLAPPTPKCAKCGKNTSEIDLGKAGRFVNCKNCGTRKRIKLTK